jgi:NAD(P)-dependent dehydrogenase (short-subunit alcohol dehydrogenase family)
MEQLEGKVAVVTGAASGIGRAMVNRFGAAGMRVVMADVEKAALVTATDEVRAAGIDAHGIVTDVSSWDSVAALRDETLDRFGAVHVVCNNAGVGGGGLTWECTLDDWNWVIGVDLFGVIYGIRAFVPLLIEQGEGHVVNTASVAGLSSPPFMGPYNVSKHGVVTLSETLYAELAFSAPDIGVTVVCPGWVKTRVGESGRNRPVELGGLPEGEEPELPEAGTPQAAARELIQGLIASGVDPSVVADAVLDAVRTRRFYVFTHPELNEGFLERTRRMVEGENPAVATELFDQG